MNEAWIMLKNVLIFVALAVPGYILVKTKVVKREHSAALSKLLAYVGMPFLVVTSIYKIPFGGGILTSLLWTFVITVAYTLVTVFVSKPMTAGEQDAKKRGMMRFCAIFSNNGFLGIPLVLAAFGATSEVFFCFIVLSVVTNVFMNTVGLYLISQDKSLVNWKRALLHPVVIALVVGVILNLVKINDYLPEWGEYSQYFSNIVTPISMTILGMKLGEIRFSSVFSSKRVYLVAAAKLFLVPMVVTAVLLPFNKFLGLDTAVLIATFVSFAMPTATLSSTFADGFGGDTEGAVSFTLSSTLMSVVTMPGLYYLLCLIL